ncbi:MAG TPA: VOC family protein [Gaiellaceae bacterium]|nr:VOC family protein [Gaiellaceae bacterium]
MRIWYRVSDLDAARAFYRDTLGLTETFVDQGERWASFERGVTEIVIGEAAEERADADGPVATIDVEDVKSERERLAAVGVEVGTVLELHGAMRLLDVFDPDGNRIQLAEDLA